MLDRHGIAILALLVMVGCGGGGGGGSAGGDTSPPDGLADAGAGDLVGPDGAGDTPSGELPGDDVSKPDAPADTPEPPDAVAPDAAPDAPEGPDAASPDATPDVPLGDAPPADVATDGAAGPDGQPTDSAGDAPHPDDLGDTAELTPDATPDGAGDLPGPGDATPDGADAAGPDMPPACTSDADCNDADPCTTDSCTPTGCRHLPVRGCRPETDCQNGGDDNGNGRIDCDDPDCALAPNCIGRPAGDVCREARLVNGGAPVTAALVGQTLAYEGDTTGYANDYACGVDLGAPDEAYELELADPLVVTITLDFADADPDWAPWGELSLYAELCWPLNGLDCAYGEEGTEDVVVLSRTLLPGLYYVIVDGLALDEGDFGPYTLQFAFAAPPSTETDCLNAIDDDADGASDCADPDCAENEACPPCPITGAIACASRITGTLPTATSYAHYTFEVETQTNVRVTIETTPDYTDQFQINYWSGDFGPDAGGCYGEDWVSVMHTAEGDLFTARPGVTYTFKTFFAEESFVTGSYAFTVACNDEGPEAACGNAEDDDADSFVDCEDPDCFASADCTGGATGETCLDPFPVADDAAITLADLGEEGLAFTFFNDFAGAADDLAAACLPTTAAGPDQVYRFTLADTLTVSAFVDSGFYDPWGAPGLYLYRAECTPEAFVGCGETIAFFDFGMAMLDAELPPGSYDLVVDSGATGFDGLPDAGPYALQLAFAAPTTPEICDNAIDDEGDERIDCLDPECYRDDVCTGGHSGEECSDPLPLAAEPLGVDASVTAYNTTIGRSNDFAGSCSTYSALGPDAVHGFSLAADSLLTATVTFANGFAPVLLLYPADDCGPATELACTRDWEGTTSISETLPAGAYVLVVDCGDTLTGSFSAPPAASDYELTVTVAAPTL